MTCTASPPSRHEHHDHRRGEPHESSPLPYPDRLDETTSMDECIEQRPMSRVARGFRRAAARRDAPYEERGRENALHPMRSPRRRRR